MRVLLLGSDGHEHALVWRIAQSSKIEKLYITSGNTGANAVGEDIEIKVMDFPALEASTPEQKADMIVVSPEDPLVQDIPDHFKGDTSMQHIATTGPSTKDARPEGGKEFAREPILHHSIPTTCYKSITADTLEEGLTFLDTLTVLHVLKVDSSRTGRGVLIFSTLKEARKELEEILSGMFGGVNAVMVIEEFLSDIECPVFVLSDGEHYKVLPVVKDYKCIGEGDKGLNIGGTGGVAPVPFANGEFMGKVCKHTMEPTINGLREENILYKGLIFLGLINAQNEPMMIEYNICMDDPETGSVMLRIKSDIVELLEGIHEVDLGIETMGLDPRTATCIMLVNDGYPEAYQKGYPMSGLDSVEATGSVLSHADTVVKDRHIITNSRYVIAVCSYGTTKEKVLEKGYKMADMLSFEGKYFRRDVGFGP